MSYVSKPRIVIVGAGFGGLAAAEGLKRLPVDVTLIDRQNHHLFQPLLYQVATAGLSPADIAWPVRHVLRRQANTRVLMGEVTAVDPARKVVMLDAGPIAYDYLVLATGATHGYFGRDEWAVHAPGLKTLDDATAIRRRLLLAFERAEMASNPVEGARLLTIVIVGGGPTGVELAGAVAELTRRALARDFRVIDPTRTRVLLVESGPRLLANFPEALSRYTATALERLGVEVRLGKPVTHCDGEGVAHRRRAHRGCDRHLGRRRSRIARRQLARRRPPIAPGACRSGRISPRPGIRTSTSSATRRSRRIRMVRRSPALRRSQSSRARMSRGRLPRASPGATRPQRLCIATAGCSRRSAGALR